MQYSHSAAHIACHDSSTFMHAPAQRKPQVFYLTRLRGHVDLEVKMLTYRVLPE